MATEPATNRAWASELAVSAQSTTSGRPGPGPSATRLSTSANRIVWVNDFCRRKRSIRSCDAETLQVRLHPHAQVAGRHVPHEVADPVAGELDGEAPGTNPITVSGPNSPEDYLVTNPYAQVLGKRQLLDAIRSGRIRHAFYERQIERFRVHGNTAIVMGHETVVDTGPVIRRRYTEVWIRAGERWQAVARHANEIRVG